MTKEYHENMIPEYCGKFNYFKIKDQLNDIKE